MYKVLALFGKSGSGKDTLLNKLKYEHPEFNKITITTTRPKRDYEVDGLDYHFIDPIQFAEMIVSGELIEASSFNDWFYGTSIKELKEDTLNIGVFSINAIECMMEIDNIKIYPVWINAKDKTRLLRNLNREDNPNCHEICRRYFSDDKDFKDIGFEHYWVIDNERPEDFFRLRDYVEGSCLGEDDELN